MKPKAEVVEKIDKEAIESAYNQEKALDPLAVQNAVPLPQFGNAQAAQTESPLVSTAGEALPTEENALKRLGSAAANPTTVLLF